MYTFKPSLFIFLLSLSMHAICDARNIGVVSEGFHTKVLFSAKVGEKVEHSTDTVLGSNDREGISEKSSAPGAAIMTRESKDSKAITKSSGSQIFKSLNAFVESLKATNIEGYSTRRALSVVGFGSDNVKKATESGENEVQEDAEVMDYGQPHRKPPIHNRKTLVIVV
ncbi:TRANSMEMBRANE PROTEIN [Salix koriyanagi]|uniref:TRANSMEMBRANE PROTEIN n=1 Tax=Salix koriyanagi TaxID=2511006 RepID=A0A9Q0Q812_9ROSI|nr:TRANSMEMBRANE PROTEIN [Salix koriyanagi]